MGIPWWQVAGFFGGGLAAGVGFVALAVYEERRQRRRDKENPPP
jgi:hypothetical protein